MGWIAAPSTSRSQRCFDEALGAASESPWRRPACRSANVPAGLEDPISGCGENVAQRLCLSRGTPAIGSVVGDGHNCIGCASFLSARFVMRIVYVMITASR